MLFRCVACQPFLAEACGAGLFVKLRQIRLGGANRLLALPDQLGGAVELLLLLPLLLGHAIQGVLSGFDLQHRGAQGMVAIGFSPACRCRFTFRRLGALAG